MQGSQVVFEKLELCLSVMPLDNSSANIGKFQAASLFQPEVQLSKGLFLVQTIYFFFENILYL